MALILPPVQGDRDGQADGGEGPPRLVVRPTPAIVERPLARPTAVWNGAHTSFCVDLHCTCGATGHCDGARLSYVRCGVCGRAYQLGRYIRLLPVTADELTAWGQPPVAVFGVGDTSTHPNDPEARA